MRIFVILSRVPYPLEKGDKLRAFHQIRVLSEKHEIILCALNPVKKLDKQSAFSALQPYCRSVNFLDLSLSGQLWNMIRAYFLKLPLQSGYFYQQSAARKIKTLIREYQPDHIYCQLLRTAEYVKDIPIPKTLDYQDVFSYGVKRRISKASLFMRPFLRMEYKRLLRYETMAFDLFDHKTIISYPDRELIPHPDREDIVVIPNGVDHAYFTPREAERKYDLVFTGNMAYPPNVDAAVFLADEIMPIVWETLPAAKVMIAGASPERRVLALSSERVRISGWMDDIRDAYAGARLFIAPMRIGTGLQNKLLEAMAMKRPSITTPLANDALKATPNEHILVGESPRELARHIVNLLTDESLSERIAHKGYEFVNQHYSWQDATEKLGLLMSNTPNKIP